jgi:hypothetical protein
MQSGAGLRAGSAQPRYAYLVRKHVARLCAMLAAAVTVAGCVTDGDMASRPQGGTIAFESIDGPPPDVFHDYVQALSAEADTRQLAVVSRENPAAYRVRGYLAAHVQRGKTSIAWALDVYDADQRRLLRLTGQESAGSAGRNAWNAANREVVRRIAQAGIAQLAGRLGSEPAPAAPEPSPVPAIERNPDSGVAVAAAQGDFRPETAGIFRLLGESPPATTDVAAAGTADVPLPRRRPTRTAKLPVPQTLALVAE